MRKRRGKEKKMVTREVSLYLKYPGSQDTLRRVQNSLLECVIEYKTGKEAVLLTTSPKELKSEYRLKGSVCLVDDELIVQFKPKNVGLHTVRIFSDTRELCRPVAFLVDHHCDVEATAYSQPIKPTASYVRRSPALSLSAQPQQQQRQSTLEDVHQQPDPTARQPDQQSPESIQPRPPLSPFREPPNIHPEVFDGGHNLMRGFTSDPTLSPPEVHPSPLNAEYVPAARLPGGGNTQWNQRTSFISGAGSRPISMTDDNAQFSGDLHSTVPERKSFQSLYREKQVGLPSYGVRKDPLAFSHNTVITPDTFKLMSAKKKSKRRCGICTKKLKTSKLIEMGEDDFCDACFRRQYLVRSAIEHFMIPTVEECTVEVPVNKKSTKFITTRKTIPNVNLRGLEPSEVKYAQGEFKKFDMEGNGWISRALLFPLMKACFYYTLQDKEIKSLLLSSALQSVIKSYGLDKREEVHEVEFLALLAFVARERQRLRTNTNPHTKFTHSDLEMAYAFRHQFQGAAQAQRSRPVAAQDHYQSPQHTSPTHSMSPSFQSGSPPNYQLSTSMSMPQPMARQPQPSGYSYGPPQVIRSPTETSVQSHVVHPPINLNASMVASPQVPTFSPTSIKRPASNVNPLQFTPYRAVSPGQGARVETERTNTAQQQPVGFQPRSAVGVLRQAWPPASHTLGTEQQDHIPSALNANAGFELPEEDRGTSIEGELPQLPPEKDPQGQTLTRAQPKKKANKEMMEELKLTGGVADGWMLY